MAVMNVVDDDPEAALRKRLSSRLTTPGAPIGEDPVYGSPESTPPPPVVSPGGPITSSPTPTKLPTTDPASTEPLRYTPPPYQTMNQRDDEGDGGGATTPTTPTSTTPAPAPPGMTVDQVLPDGRTVYRDQYGQLFTANPRSVTGYDLYKPPTTTPAYGTEWTDPGFIGWADFFTGGGAGKNPTFGGNYQGFFNAMFPGETLTPEMLKAKEKQLASAGIKLMPNAAGVNAKIQLPNGQIIDVIQGAGSGLNRRQWLVGSGGAGAGAGAGAGVGAGQSAFQGSLRAILMERLRKAQLPVDENDAYIREPFSAASLQAARTQQGERTALAERLAATGDTSRSLEMGIQQSAERNAVGLGTFKGKLIQEEYTRRHQELLDLMQLAIATSDQQALRDIQTAIVALQQARWDTEMNLKLGTA